MALSLMNPINSLRFSPCVNICCNLRKKCEYSSLAYYTVHKTLSKRYIQHQVFPVFQKEVTINKDGKFTIPIVPGSNFTKHDVAESYNTITSDDISLIKWTETDVLEPCTEDVSDIAPFASPAFHLAAYVNSSYTLQQFVQMGVQIHIVEEKKGAAELFLKLDFEKQVKPYVRFLHDVGVPAEELGKFVTKNPLIFEQSLDDLQIRINYLEAKKFTSDGISRIVTKNPLWLNFSTVDIDKRLGFFQRCFVLSGDEVRMVAVKRPALITHRLDKITVAHFTVKEVMGFDEVGTKNLLLNAPKLFHISSEALKDRFDFVHNLMEISHEQILQQPNILTFRGYIVKQRHEFLKELGKAQYNPKLPNYISLNTLVLGSDVDFCKNVAKTSIDVFNAFLKTR